VSALEVAWYFIVVFLFVVYAVLDGFDLGVGFWGLFARKDEDRAILARAIGPVWDGNEVWLIGGAVALYAAFPAVYGGLLSGLYPAAMLIVFTLVLRAAAIEFRGFSDAKGREAWDAVFSVSSVVPVVLLGVALGNLLRGLPFDSSGGLAAGTLDLLNPYALLLGITALAMTAAHGAIYLTLKTRGALQKRAEGWAMKSWSAYLVLAAAACAWSVARMPHLLGNYRDYPAFLLAPVLTFGGLVAVRVYLKRRRHMRAFLSSALSVAAFLFSAAFALFPMFAPVLGDPGKGLSIANTVSSDKTLTAMLVIVLVGMPLVLIYEVYAYRTHAGVVDVKESDYGP
jgi:cytochrome d ubiquinol oxidase subunit II